MGKTVVRHLVLWSFFAALIGVASGCASALFLLSLDRVTEFREMHPWLVWLLPFAGFGMAWVYHLVGPELEKGNNLILEEIHDPRQVLPLLMAPLILAVTLLTHLFGGSVGREGTAVQMGAAIADQLTHRLRKLKEHRKVILMAGMSAGFGSVFGTPLAGAVFGIEVLVAGRMRYDALFPCLIASIAGDVTCHAWGVHHSVLRVPDVPALSLASVLSATVAGIVFGLAAISFAWSMEGVSHFLKRKIRFAPYRSLLGGAVVALSAAWVGTRYLGLGTPVVTQAFVERVPAYDFIGKMFFTVATLGSGFKGGEVTPLFFIGSTLGNTLSSILPLPFPLLAGMGFAAVFAGASKTPIASTLMAIEVLGAEGSVYFGIACVMSYLVSGEWGIYSAQKRHSTDASGPA